MSIDWTKPIARRGRREILTHRTKTGTDRWVIIDGSHYQFTKDGTHVCYGGEDRQYIENLEPLDLDIPMRFRDTRARLWFSHYDDETQRFFVASTKDGIYYTFSRFGQCVDKDNTDRWVENIPFDDLKSEAQRAIAKARMERRHASMVESMEHLPGFGSF